jgi:uncharacterized protein YukJ
MNKKIKELALQAGGSHYPDVGGKTLEKFAELVVEAVLDQVEQRAYYTGDRDWSDELDRPWIQLEFGYGKLHDAKTSGVKK